MVDAKKTIGKCKWFDKIKGYGFIVCDKTTKDIFFHKTEIETFGKKEIREGDEVEFEMIETPKGVQAVKISIRK